MATDKPRVMITLDPDTYQTVKRLAELNKSPVSRVVSSLIIETHPVLKRLVRTLELAQKADASTKAKMREVVERSEAEFLPLAQAALDQFDLFANQVGCISEESGTQK